MKYFLACAALITGFSMTKAAFAEMIAYQVKDVVPDALQVLSPAQIKLEGLLGERVIRNEQNRLLNINEDVLLAGFRKPPGEQAWIGEHVGKFLHAATLAWANTADPQLKAKIDRVAAELIKCQAADGYLGTYLPKDRWTAWDVWVHKYNLIGLLTYYQYTGNQPALETCKRIGDLLISTFPGKKSIIKAGEHVGMAATSVLEPIVILYRFTGEQKYLDFAKYIISSYDEPGGPRVIKTLLAVKRVDKTANGKAYEMMSNLVGLCELYRVTGQKDYLDAAKNAWEDIVANHLYITGSVSQGEHFHEPHALPNGEKSNVAETCATVTYLQLTAQLFRITGDARYGDELEKTLYNHLAAAQRPDGAQWCYFTSLSGRKPYGPGVNCCVSSGPRGMALAPQLACLKSIADGKDALAVNLIEPLEVTTSVAGQNVKITSQIDAEEGAAAALVAKMTYTLEVAQPTTFALKVRSPAWAGNLNLSVEGTDIQIAGPKGGWAVIPSRQWKTGDQVVLTFQVKPRVILGDYTNKGFSALAWGPFVLAYDDSYNQGLGPIAGMMLAEPNDAPVISPEFSDPWIFQARVKSSADAHPKQGSFVLFADAGAKGGRYQVWLRNIDNPAKLSLLSGGVESRSRQGNQPGSIIDGDDSSIVVTFDAKAADEDWYAVALDSPVSIKRIVFAHGRSFHDGGWFDASGSKPKIQIQQEKGGPWQTVGTLDSYPTATATNNGGLKDGQQFELTLSRPVNAVAVRIVGKPACGDNTNQAFSSCAELAAFPD